MSSIYLSHKQYVADIAFIPLGVTVDRRNPNEGKYCHVLSVSEDGIVNIWDTRHVERELVRKTPDLFWKPVVTINIMREGAGELGLAKILFDYKSALPIFMCGSDEGDLVQIDWSVKPAGGEKEADANKFVEYIKLHYDSQRNYRPILALQYCPFD
jgi:hypothetical protein